MVDEQLYMSSNRIGEINDKYLRNLKEIKEEDTNEKIGKMRLRLPE